MSISKQKILEAIRKAAEENGGKPLGEVKFRKETGINQNDYCKYWARFGDAQREAGFEPNQFQIGYSNEFISEKIIGLIRKIRKFPTTRERIVERNTDPEFPSHGTFRRLRTQEQIATTVLEYCADKNGYDDIIEICKPILKKSEKKEIDDLSNAGSIGEVYLFKSGRYYKIGKTNDTVRRGSEIRIQLPEKLDLIHSIKTDDPSGIEAYWHKRFASKRMQGEWFDLSTTDIRAFKLWRRIS